MVIKDKQYSNPYKNSLDTNKNSLSNNSNSLNLLLTQEEISEEN